MPTHAIATTGEQVDPTTGELNGYMTKYKSYVALFSQQLTGVNPGDPFEAGKIYKIIGYTEGDDFTNAGAMANENNRLFASNGQAPAVWTNGSTVVKGFEPVIEVMNSSDSNFLGNIVWEWYGGGYFNGKLQGAFVAENKCFTTISSGLNNINYMKWLDEDNIELYSSLIDGSGNVDGLLKSHAGEIRVYQ